MKKFVLVLILGVAGVAGYGWFLVDEPYRGYTGESLHRRYQN